MLGTIKPVKSLCIVLVQLKNLPTWTFQNPKHPPLNSPSHVGLSKTLSSRVHVVHGRPIGAFRIFFSGQRPIKTPTLFFINI